MRRFFPLLFLAVLLTVLITSVGLAQGVEDGSPVINGQVVDRSSLPGPMIDGALSDLPQRFSASGTLSIQAEDPADRCEDATDIALIPSFPADGVSFDVKNATEEATDPVMACMWGNPPRSRGFRTVWYRLVVPISGRITLDTFSSAYDTVVGVYSGECGSLVALQCNDDTNGFSSETTIAANAGDIYYIEVASWQPGLPGPAILNFSALLQPITPFWETVETNTTSPAITRHSTVAKDNYLFVIGGQTGESDIEGVPFVSNALLRLNTSNNNWKTMSQLPGAGYSNTTAALVGDHIYVPSGYNGNNLGYDGLHWQYTIPTDAADFGSWKQVEPVPRTNGNNFAWAASAVPPSNDRYYLMGGTSSTDLFAEGTIANNNAYVFLAEEDTWLDIPSMLTARYAATGSWVSTNNLGACVAGGLGTQTDGAFVLHTSAECYHPAFGWRFIGDMNIPRIGAGSATGPDGNWYVFGGLTVVGELLLPVLRTEMYDPRQGTWTLLPPDYNLGGQDLLSARAFPSGSFVGNDLYVTGGSIFVEGEHALPLTEKLPLPPFKTYLPHQTDQIDAFLAPDDNFSQARPLPFGFHYHGNFQRQRDFYDFFTFTLTTPQTIQINLEVPDNNNFDLYLFGQNKLQWDSSTQPLNGADESITLLLDPRRYFVMVERVFPAGQPDSGARYDLVILN